VGLTLLAGLAVALFALPLLGLLGDVSWGELWRDLTAPASLTALRLSLLCSTAAAALSVVLGLPLAWRLAHGHGRGWAMARGLVLLPLVLPPVVGGVALLSAFSRQSLLGGALYDAFGVQLTFSPAGVVLAETFVAMPFFVLTVEAALRAFDARYEEVAATLGASRGAALRTVTLPLVLPSVVAGAVLAWARALGEFGATITFAGNVEGRTQTLPLAVYLQLESQPSRAVSLSLLLLAVALVVLVAVRQRAVLRS
jgi:molybdate transport system permease protein